MIARKYIESRSFRRYAWMKTDWSLSKKFGPKGWIVTIRIINSEIRMRYMNYVKLLNWTLMQKNMYFYSFSISKCILNRSLRWVLELIVLVLLTEEV